MCVRAKTDKNKRNGISAARISMFDVLDYKSNHNWLCQILRGIG